MPRPIPADPPVMIAVFPSKRSSTGVTVDQTGLVLEVLPLSQADQLPPGTGLAPVDPDVVLADQIRAAASDDVPAVVDFLIDELGCEALLDRVPRPMSRGELQICALLITLAAPFETLTLVDPTAGLDAPKSRTVADLLADLGEHHPITVASDALALAVHRAWEPLTVEDVARLFADAPMRWWISGGHALVLHLGHDWRDHADIDVGIVRDEAHHLREVLDGWDIQVAAAGVLSPWDGRPLDEQRHENNLWCRRTPDAPFSIDVTVGAGDDAEWAYRRDAAIRRPWSEAVLTDPRGVPYLAPELQLLFKGGSHMRRKDEMDGVALAPLIGAERWAWVLEHLPPDHPWQHVRWMTTELRSDGRPGRRTHGPTPPA